MPETIISDTSCFIILANIGELDILQKVYGSVVTTTEVRREFGSDLPAWVKIKDPSDKSRQKLLELHVDRGEASAISLAIETPNSTIILDDQKARKVAERLGIEYTGTVGVIIKAKIRQIIPSIIPFLDKLKAMDFRLSKEIEDQALDQAGENRR